MSWIKLCTLSLLLASTISAQLIGPKVTVSEKEHDFGTIIEGAIVSHEFFLINEGDADLYIIKVSASCGCTAAKPSEDKLEPGESTLLTVTFNSAHKKGNRTNYVTVSTNDKTNETLKIITTAKVLGRDEQSEEIKAAPFMSFSKLSHDFGKVKEGMKLELDVIVTNIGKSELKVDKVKASCGCTAALMSEKVIQPGKSGNLHIELDTTHMDGKKTRTIAISSNDPVNPRIVLTLFVNVEK